MALGLTLAACGENDPRASGPAANRDSGAANGQGQDSAPGSVPGAPGEVAPASPVVPPVPGTQDLPLPAGSAAAPGSDSVGDPVAAAKAGAAGAADRWEQTHRAGSAPAFVLLSVRQQQIGTPEPANAHVKASLLDGCFELRPGVTVPPHPLNGEVRRADGTVFTRPFVEPQAAFGTDVPPELRSRCGTATTPKLPVTGIKLTTGTVTTSDGQATVPLWEVSFAGTAVRGQAVAIAPDPVPGPKQGGASGPAADSTGVKATVSADGRTVTLAFYGSPDVPGPCGADYSIETAQRATVVALAIATKPRPGSADTMCRAIAAERKVSVTLAAPLGNRALIGVQGMAVPRG